MPNARFAGRIRHLLVVEDSAIVAMDLEMCLEELGVAKLTVVSDASTAIEALEAGGIDAALVDFMLGAGDGRTVADRLLALGIPFAIMTGFGNLDWLDGRIKDVPLLAKPFSNDELVATLEKLCANP